MSKPFVNWDELAWVYNLISEVHKNVETRKKNYPKAAQTSYSDENSQDDYCKLLIFKHTRLINRK